MFTSTSYGSNLLKNCDNGNFLYNAFTCNLYITCLSVQLLIVFTGTVYPRTAPVLDEDCKSYLVVVVMGIIY